MALQRLSRVAQRRHDAGYWPAAIGEHDLASLPHLFEDGRELLPGLTDAGGLHRPQGATSSTSVSNRGICWSHPIPPVAASGSSAATRSSIAAASERVSSV